MMNTLSGNITDVLKIALVTSTVFPSPLMTQGMLARQINTIACDRPVLADTRSDKLTAKFEVNVPTKKSYKDRYRRIANSAWFKKDYHGKSVDFVKIDE